MSRATIVGIVAVAAAVAAWFIENAAIHVAGYSGFGGAGWLTAIIVPIGAGIWVWDKFAASDPAGSQDA